MALIESKQVGAGFSIRRARNNYAAVKSIVAVAAANTFLVDGSLATIDRGTEVTSILMAPSKVGNLIRIKARVGYSGRNRSGMYTLAIFRIGDNTAIGQVTYPRYTAETLSIPIICEAEFTVFSLANITFSCRIGPQFTGGQPVVNGTVAGTPVQIPGNTYIEWEEYTS